MTQRHLRITIQPNWEDVLLEAGRQADQATGYVGETLNFHSRRDVFETMNERRWEVIDALQGAGEMSVRELARRLGRDMRRVHDDVVALAELGLLERTESGGVVCPFATIRLDMEMKAAA